MPSHYDDTPTMEDEPAPAVSKANQGSAPAKANRAADPPSD